jgi:hypothetical protein
MIHAEREIKCCRHDGILASDSLVYLLRTVVVVSITLHQTTAFSGVKQFLGKIDGANKYSGPDTRVRAHSAVRT